MSGSNTQVVREALEAWRGGDSEGFARLIAANAELRPLRAQLEQTAYVGPRGARRLLDDLRRDWADLDFEAEETHEEGEAVVVIGRLTARAPASGAGVDTRIGWRWVVRDGLIAFGASYSDPEEALRESGISGETRTNVAAVRRHYAAFNDADVEAIVATLHPDVEIFGGDERAGGASERYRGADEARVFFAEIKELVADNVVEILTLEATPERVVASVRLHGTLRSNELSGSVPAVHFLAVRDGLISRIETYRPNWRREAESGQGDPSIRSSASRW